MSNVQTFCGLSSNGSYVVYEKSVKTFSRCFLWTAVSYICHLMLAALCAYLLGVSKGFSSRRRSYLTIATSIISLVSALSKLTELILSYSLHRQHPPPAYILAKAISFTAWLLCFLSQRRVNSITKEKKEKNKYILFTLLFVMLSSSMQLHFVLQNISLKGYVVGDIPVDYFGVMVDFTLNVLYFVLCIGISLSKITSIQSYEPFTGSVNWCGDSADIYLGPSEVTKNIFSKLVYWWSGKLLEKGSKNQLKSPDDLFFLPENLDTESMKTLLMDKLKKEKERLLDVLRPDESTSRVITDETVKVSLFKVLNRCFGKVYYSVGILLLFSNIFQLAQPTLVHLLVSFVSDKKVCN